MIDDVFHIVEEYRIYSNGSVYRRITAEGGMPVDTDLYIEGEAVRFGAASSSAQTLTAASGEPPVMHSVHYQSDWVRVHGTGQEPIPQGDAPALVASAAAVRRFWRSSAQSLSSSRDAKRERAVRMAMQRGASESEARAFLDRMARGMSVPGGRARSLDAGASLGQVAFVEGWQADLLKDMVNKALTAVTPAALQAYCDQNNVSIGIGVIGGAGLGGALDLGAGIVFAPRNKVGFYGAVSIGGGWNFEASAGVQLTYIWGDETVFAGRAIVVGGSIDLSEGPSVGARWITDSAGNTLGWTSEVTLSAGLPYISAIEATASRQRTGTTLSARRPVRMIGGLPLAAPGAVGLGVRRRALSGRSFNVAPSSVNARLRVFIPAPAVMVEAPIIGTNLMAFGGDGRDFAYTGGTHRAQIDATLHLGTDQSGAAVTSEVAEWATATATRLPTPTRSPASRRGGAAFAKARRPSTGLHGWSPRPAT